MENIHKKKSCRLCSRDITDEKFDFIDGHIRTCLVRLVQRIILQPDGDEIICERCCGKLKKVAALQLKCCRYFLGKNSKTMKTESPEVNQPEAGCSKWSNVKKCEICSRQSLYNCSLHINKEEGPNSFRDIVHTHISKEILCSEESMICRTCCCDLQDIVYFIKQLLAAEELYIKYYRSCGKLLPFNEYRNKTYSEMMKKRLAHYNKEILSRYKNPLCDISETVFQKEISVGTDSLPTLIGNDSIINHETERELESGTLFDDLRQNLNEVTDFTSEIVADESALPIVDMDVCSGESPDTDIDMEVVEEQTLMSL